MHVESLEDAQRFVDFWKGKPERTRQRVFDATIKILERRAAFAKAEKNALEQAAAERIVALLQESLKTA